MQALTRTAASPERTTTAPSSWTCSTTGGTSASPATFDSTPLARAAAADKALSAVSGEPVVEVLNRVAHDYGRTIGGPGRGASERPPADAAAALDRALAVLREYGYEPRAASGEVELANCPFHTLAREHTELACHMNHALITGVAAALAPHGPDVRLSPGPDRCCVVLKAPATL